MPSYKDLSNDASLLTGLQAIPQWQSFAQFPSGTRLGLYASTIFLPSIPSAFLGDIIAQRYGRRLAVLSGSAIVVLGSLLNALAPNIEMWLVGRGTIGFGGAIVKVGAPALIQEIAHPRLRPMVAACYWSFFHVGAILAAFLCFGGLYIQGAWSWRMPSLFQIVGPLLVFAVCWWTPESPRWLVNQGREADARRVLIRHHANGMENDQLVMWEMDEISNALALERVNQQTRYRDFLKNRPNRRRLAVVISLCLGINWLGNGVISYYLAPVLLSVGVTQPVQITLINAGLSIWNLIVSVTSSINTERIGRRPAFLGSLTGMLLSYACIMGLSAAFASSRVAAVGTAVIPFLFIFFGFYSACWTPLPIMYTTEILPYNLRTKGIALFTSVGVAGNALNNFGNPIALQALGWRYYSVYLVIITFYIVLAYYLYPETKGYTIEEVSVIFDRGRGEHTAEILEPDVLPVLEGKKDETERIEHDVKKAGE